MKATTGGFWHVRQVVWCGVAVGTATISLTTNHQPSQQHFRLPSSPDEIGSTLRRSLRSVTCCSFNIMKNRISSYSQQRIATPDSGVLSSGTLGNRKAASLLGPQGACDSRSYVLPLYHPLISPLPQSVTRHAVASCALQFASY